MGGCCPGKKDGAKSAVSGNHGSESKQSQPPKSSDRYIFADGVEGAGDVKEKLEKSYRIEQQLGQPGQFGVAYACTRIKDGEPFAVKKIEKTRFFNDQIGCSDADRKQYYQNFRDEIKLMREMDHPNIIKLIDVFEDADNLYLVMEKCLGGELFDRIKEKQKYSEKDAAAVLREFARGIEAMHKQHIAHCDLKPDNILFLTTANDAPLKIIDFGMSKHSPPEGEKIIGFRGTPYYVAPEIVNRAEYTFHCDMWSFGVISFVMLFGFPPFHSRDGDDEKIYKKIKEGFCNETKAGFGAWFPAKQAITESAKDLISRCLETDPVKRYTATEVLEHPWVTGQSASDEPLVGQVLKNLNEFTANCRLKAAVLDMMTDILTKNEIENLQKTFKAIDADGDGQITAQELKLAVDAQVSKAQEENSSDKLRQEQDLLEIQNFKKIIKLADQNGDGKLSYKELLATSVQRKMKLKQERMISAFQKFDSDSNGQITIDELKQMMAENGKTISTEEANAIIAEVDKDNDGMISKEEFLDMWGKKQQNYMDTLLGEQ